MNCCRLTRHLVNGPLRISAVSHIGKHRTINPALIINSGSVRSYYNGCRILESSRSRLRRGLQRHGSAVWYACCSQANNVAVHRVWRGQQTGIFHLKLWGSGALTVLISCLVSRIFLRALIFVYRCIKSKGNRFLLSGTGAFVYDWKDKIPDNELTKYFDEIEAALCLKKRTFEINHPVVTTRCTCDGGTANHSQFERESDPWSTFLVLPHLYVWKREVPNHHGDGLFEYKVYGKYTDVTAVDFLDVNIDTMYRKMWDTGAVILEILETDKASKSNVIYWEMAWPAMMSNRDYVYMRRYIVDNSKKVMVIVNQNTTHADVPPLPGKERVSEYWSIIVIKPITDINKPGIEFTMTYFDNPGANVPSSIMTWASSTAFPDFHRRLHKATKEYASRKSEIAAFTQAEEAKGSSIKKGRKRPVKCIPQKSGASGENWSSFDDILWEYEEECKKEEEAENNRLGKKAPKKDPTEAEKKRRKCVIRKKEDYLYKHYSWIGTT